MNAKLIVLIGPGGSGKSFMADRLGNYYANFGETFDIFEIASGDQEEIKRLWANVDRLQHCVCCLQSPLDLDKLPRLPDVLLQLAVRQPGDDQLQLTRVQLDLNGKAINVQLSTIVETMKQFSKKKGD